MDVEIGAEAAQFPGKEYINGIAVAVSLKFESLVNPELWRIFHYIYFSSANRNKGFHTCCPAKEVIIG
jgi:hypothetical protein